MDINLPYTVSNEDLVGVLKTILLFLDSINFKATSAVLLNECSSNGYTAVASAPAKIVMVHPSTVKPATSHQESQTEFSLDDYNSYELENSVHDDIDFENNSNSNPFHVYCANVVPEDICLHQTPCSSSHYHETASNKWVVEKVIKEPTERQNMSPNKQIKNLENKRSPNTIESEVPSKISSKNFSKKSSGGVIVKLRKTHSNPVLNTNSKSTKVNENNEGKKMEDSPSCSTQILDITDSQELKKRFRQLQNEHKKLMGVAAELTTALQTHILGQSENLNSMLNNCRNIYPDLFNTMHSQNSNNFQNILTKHTSPRDTTSSTKPSREDASVEVLFGQNIRQNPLSTNANKSKDHIINERIFSSPASNKNIKTNTNISHGSPPSNEVVGDDKISKTAVQSPTSKSIRNSDNIIQGLPSSHKSVHLSDNTFQGPIHKSDNITQHPPSSNKGIEISNIVQRSTSKSIRNSDNIIQGLPSSSKSIRNSDKISQGSLSSNKNVEDNQTTENNHYEDGVLVEIKSVASDGSYSTTILAPRLKRPHSSSIILLTTNDESLNRDSNILIRQLSNRSLNEPLLVNASKASESSEANSKVSFEEANTREITTLDEARAEITRMHKTCQTPEINNAEQQTSYHTVDQELHEETPEIFVTTENLEKLQRECKCKPSGDCNLYFDLDFRKLKKDMLNGDDDLKLALIQALRWRITQSDREIRDQMISSYIRHDLLGLHSAPNSCGQSTMEIYYCPNNETPHPLQEGMARLVNTFASLTLGRDYLCQDDDLLISLLVPLVIGTHYSKVEIDDITRDMLLATLQKLSIRNRQRIRMISAGLVEYLVSFLATKHTTLSEYCMEYTTALLMNLCLHSEARDRLHSAATHVVSLLADLLDTKHRSCMPYVNGAMYSLLGDSYINREAQRLNLAKLIEYHIKRTDGEIRRQLQFILRLHLKNDGENDCGCDPNVELENEVDLLEPELDSGDSFEAQPAGEELLNNYRLLFSVNGAQVNADHLKCLCRPVTPIPRSVNSNNRLAHAEDNQEGDKMTQVFQDDIIHETNFQVEQQIPEMNARKKCICVAEKSTQSENPSTDDDNSKSCACAVSTNTTEKQCNSPNEVPFTKTKPESSQSEPAACLENETEKPANKPLSEKSSRSNSPAMSFSEETKQFYHTPSAKTGIFEPQKPKRLHRVPPSFTRTIPLPQRINPPPSLCNNPHCSYPYSKSMPVTPIENSSARNPPYALDYPNEFTTCYRDSYTNQMTNPNNNCNNCPNSTNRNKYRCNCYNVIKGYVEGAPQDNMNSNRNENTSYISSSQENTDRSFVPHLHNLGCDCYSSTNPNTRRSTVHSHNDSAAINRGIDGVVNFSYEELLNTVHSDNDHVCPNPAVECRCYDVVFQSRPKILRTPP